MKSVVLSCVLLSAFLSGCGSEMVDESRTKPFEASRFFRDGRSARPLVQGTVARGHLQTDTHFYRGRSAGEFATGFPFPVTEHVLNRGEERFNIYCSVCHGRTGNGDGMVVQRGFAPAASFHVQRLRDVPEGYLFDVITNGMGNMAAYKDRLKPGDRWAVVAYLRALQFSQNVPLDVAPEPERKKLLEEVK